jgi:hypothetical protein
VQVEAVEVVLDHLISVLCSIHGEIPSIDDQYIINPPILKYQSMFDQASSRQLKTFDLFPRH